MLTPEQLSKIREFLPPNAVAEIAEQCGKSKSHVYKVLTGTKENFGIISAAQQLAEKHKAQLAELKEKIGQL